jgi:WD40 repeat protein
MSIINTPHFLEAILATGSDDKPVKLWEIATGKELTSLKGHNGGVWTMAFSPDGKTIATGSDDKMIKLWGVATGQELATLNGDTDWILSVAFAPSGLTPSDS